MKHVQLLFFVVYFFVLRMSERDERQLIHIIQQNYFFKLNSQMPARKILANHVLFLVLVLVKIEKQHKVLSFIELTLKFLVAKRKLRPWKILFEKIPLTE